MSIKVHDDIRVLISACLLGLPCQYNGQTAIRQLRPSVLKAIGSQIIPVCPEQMAGLSTPRPPVEVNGGDGQDVLRGTARVLSQDGQDFTTAFLLGAEATLQVARLTGATAMITQKRSPSCSCAGIYDGTFSHTLYDGYGVCAALLQAHGMQLWDVDEFETAWVAAGQS